MLYDKNAIGSIIRVIFLVDTLTLRELIPKTKEALPGIQASTDSEKNPMETR